MTWGGVILMSSSLAFVIGLWSFCAYRITRGPKPRPEDRG